jgi:hypothetical protein
MIILVFIAQLTDIFDPTHVYKSTISTSSSKC